MELVRNEQPPPAEAMAAAADDRTKQQEPSRVVCFGEILVDFVPLVGGLPIFDEPGFKAGAGGAPANVAVGICKLGNPAAFIGKLGDDEFGYALANVLKEHGVETRGVRFDSHAHTGLAFISLRSDGERTFIFYRNPSADMLMVSTNKDLTVHIHF
jgi:fructokinase